MTPCHARESANYADSYITTLLARSNHFSCRRGSALYLLLELDLLLRLVEGTVSGYNYHGGTRIQMVLCRVISAILLLS
jgi:hypothetical protein